MPSFVWLIGLPLLASPIIYLGGRLSRQWPGAPGGVARWLSVLALAAAWVPFVQAALDLNRGGAVNATLGTITLRLDGVSLLLAAVALGLASLAALFSVRDIAGEVGEEKYYALLLASVGIMVGLGCAQDLFNLWLWFEGLAISTYLLVAFYRDQPASLESGVKYLVQSAAGSTLVLLGIALVLMQTGTLSLPAIGAVAGAQHAPALLAAIALLIIGFGVKAALVPLHTWLPDAHSQAPSGISALLSGVVIAAGLVAMLRGVLPLVTREGLSADAGLLFMALGALNMIWGNLMALRQTRVKRLLAYSSLAHIGYMLFGFGVALFAQQAAGAEGGFFHLVNHGLMKGLAFLAAGALVYALQAAPGQHSPLAVSDLAGAAQKYPVVALSLSVAVLGLGGLPPLAGFMSKWQIFVAGFATHDVAVSLLVGFAALNSVLSLAYYAPLVNNLYRRQPSEAVQRGRPIPLGMLAPLMVLGLAVLVVGLWPDLLHWLVGPAGAALIAVAGH
jgi:proton-translocating NADH-quinone oxidoreductase chain N